MHSCFLQIKQVCNGVSSRLNTPTFLKRNTIIASMTFATYNSVAVFSLPGSLALHHMMSQGSETFWHYSIWGLITCWMSQCCSLFLKTFRSLSHLYYNPTCEKSFTVQKRKVNKTTLSTLVFHLAKVNTD